jgi:hypothetical protein
MDTQQGIQDNVKIVNNRERKKNKLGRRKSTGSAGEILRENVTLLFFTLFLRNLADFIA